MSSNSKVTPDTRRRTLIGLAGLAASASALKTAWGAEAGPFAIKRASLLQRRPGISHEEFVKHWVEIHAPMARLLGAQNQLGFLGSGGHTGTAGTKPFRFGISIFGRLLASRTSLS